MLIRILRPLTEALIKYFLVQAFASSLLIVSALVSLTTFKFINLSSREILISMALAIKAGVPPFHFWFPEVSNKLNWTQCFILFTWQKIAPLLLLAPLSFNLTCLLALAAVLTGAIGGLNQLYTKILLAYSSISHRGWLIIACLSSFKAWLNYFTIYRFLSLCIIFSLQDLPIKKISQITIMPINSFIKIIFSLNMLSLGGLPPLLGFLAKLSILSLLLHLNLFILALIFVLSSLASLYYYLRILYSFLITSEPKKIPSLIPPQKIKRTLLVWCTALNIAAPSISLLL